MKNNALSLFVFIFVQLIGDIILSIDDNRITIPWVSSLSLVVYFTVGFTLLKNHRTVFQDLYSVSLISIIAFLLWILCYLSFKNIGCGGFVCMPDLIWFIYMYFNNFSIMALVSKPETEYYYLNMLLLNFIPSLVFWIGLSVKRVIHNFRRC